MSGYPLPALDVKPPQPGPSALDMYKGMLGMQVMQQQVQKNQMNLDDQKIFRQSYLDSIDPDTGKPDDEKTILTAAKRGASPQGIQAYQLHVQDLKDKAAALVKSNDEHAKLQTDLIGQAAQATLSAPPEKKQKVYQQWVQRLENNKVIQPGQFDPNTVPDDDTLKFYSASAMQMKDQMDEARKVQETAIKQPGEAAESAVKQRSNAATILAGAKTQEDYSAKWGQLPASVAQAFPKPEEWSPNSRQTILQAGMTPKEVASTPIANQAAQAWLADPNNRKPDGSPPTMVDFLRFEKTIPQQFTMSGGGLIPPTGSNPPMPVPPSAIPNAPQPVATPGGPGNIPLTQPIADVRTGAPLVASNAPPPLPGPGMPAPSVSVGANSPMPPDEAAKYGLKPTGVKDDGSPIYTATDPEAEFRRQQSTINNEVPESIRDRVKAIVDYRQKLPAATGIGSNNPTSQALNYWVNRVDPNWDIKNFDSRHKMMLDYTNHSGGTGKQIDAINTVGGHLATLNAAIDYLDNGNIKLLNRLANFVGVQTGSDKKKVFDTIIHRIGPEITQAYIASGGSAGERGSNETDWDPSLGPKVLKATSGVTAQLLESKLESVEQGWQTTMGRQDFRQRFLTPRARQAFQELNPQSPIKTNFDKTQGQPVTPQPVARPKLSPEDIKKRDQDLGVVYK